MIASNGARRWKLQGNAGSKQLWLGAAMGSLVTVAAMLVSSGVLTCESSGMSVSVKDDIHLHLDGFKWGDKAFFGNFYMKKRIANYTYYKSVLRLSHQYAPDAQSVIDVGAPWPFVTAFDWIPRKVMLNDRYPEGMTTPPGVSAIEEDFYSFEPEQKFDLVICNQVMEHVPDPASFARKLLSIGHVVIASVPYMWPANAAFGHRQHMINHEQLLSWFNRRDYSEIGVVKEVQRNCGEVCRRIYVVYQAPVPASRKIHDPTHDLNKAKEGQQQDVDEDDDDENVVQDLQELDQR